MRYLLALILLAAAVPASACDHLASLGLTCSDCQAGLGVSGYTTTSVTRFAAPAPIPDPGPDPDDVNPVPVPVPVPVPTPAPRCGPANHGYSASFGLGSGYGNFGLGHSVNSFRFRSHSHRNLNAFRGGDAYRGDAPARQRVRALPRLRNAFNALRGY